MHPYRNIEVIPPIRFPIPASIRSILRKAVRTGFRPALAMAALAGALAPAFAVETPFTPYKDGYAAVSTYTGNSRTLLVRAGDYKAWVSHALADGAGEGLLKAHMQVYVKDIFKDGKLIVWLGSSLTTLENQTHFTDLRTKDTVGSVDLQASKHIQGMVDIPLNAAFVKSVVDGNYTGLVLEGGAGLDAELGALEGSHGAILYLDYGSANPAAQAKLVDSVAAALATKYSAELKGGKGDKGDVGSKGDTGPQGSQGLQGVNGIKGDKGEPGDSPTLFNLVLDRGQRAFYTFDVFRGLPQTTPDSSGQGNTLTLATNGLSKVDKGPGDAAILFIGTGYASAPNSQSLNPYKEITLSARIRMSVEGATDSQTVISKPNQYELAVQNKKLRVRFKTVLGTYDWQGDGKVDTGWHSIQATFDGSAVRTFVDGIQTYYARSATGPLAADTNALYLGAQSPSAYGFWGTLDSVRVLSYSVNSQDSIRLLPGLITRSQMVADSVAGFDAKVNANVDSRLAAKANLSGAAFDGKVRVGATGSPIAELEVLDSPNDSDSRADLYLRGLSGSGGVLRFYDNTIERATMRGDNPGDLTFQTGGTAAAGPGEKMRITAAGNVGIGIVSPTAPLDVAGNIRSTGTVITGRLTTNSAFATAVATIEASGTRYLEMRDGANVKSFIDPPGKTNIAYFSQKFGIGDSTPPGSFVVRGGVASAGAGLPVILSAQQGATGQSGGDLILNSGPNGSGGANGSILFGSGGVIDALGQLSASGEKMRIDASGRVGLGMSNPSSAMYIRRDEGVADGEHNWFFIERNGANNGTDPAIGIGYRADGSDPSRVFFRAANSFPLDFGTSDNTQAMTILNNGNVGINQTNPTSKLHVTNSGLNGHARILVETVGSPDYGEAGFTLRTPGGSWDWFMDDNTGNDVGVGNMGLWQAGTLRLAFLTNGNLGIGANKNPAEKLDVAGNIKATGTITPSDRRYKKNIRSIEGAAEKILALRGVSYEWKTEEFPDRGFAFGNQLGFIAQEVETVVPELVHTDDQGYKSVDYAKVAPILVEAIKAQQAEIAELKSLVCLDHPDASACK